MEALRADSVLESPSAHRSAKELTTATDGVRGEEWLEITLDDSVEMTGAMAGATESLEARAGAADIVLESAA